MVTVIVQTISQDTNLWKPSSLPAIHWLAKSTCHDEVALNRKQIKPVVLAIVELCLSEI